MVDERATRCHAPARYNQAGGAFMSVETQAAEPALNATPLIDVLLVLLVMLILTVPVATHAVKLDLPAAGPGVPPPAIRLEILHGGDIYWNGKFMPTVESLEPLLVEVARSPNPPLLKVAPEKRAPYERVAQVLAAAQRSHVDRLSVTTVADF
jgi:biopolymer transport protein ExbD